MLDLKLLTLIINEVGNLTLRTDSQHYKLELIIKAKDLRQTTLDELVIDIKLDYLFKYCHSSKDYRLYSTKLIKLLEQLDQLQELNILLNKEMFTKFDLILDNRDLFTRPKGKRLAEEELAALEELHLQFKELSN